MARRRTVGLLLLIAATLHCGELLGQDPPEPTLPVAPPPTSGGELVVTRDGAADGCLDLLAASGASFRAVAADDSPPPLAGCGMVDGVVVTKGPSGIRYQPPLRLSCRFALALPAVERTIQQVATDTLGESIEVARTMGSYGCRMIQSTRSPGRLSEHAFGNAADIGEWRTRHQRANVLRDFRSDEPAGRFLRAMATALRDGGVLERLLDPDTNAAHHNHFHLEGHPFR